MSHLSEVNQIAWQRASEMIKRDSSYRLAFEDPEFLMKDELRAVRLQLELLKPELYLRDHDVRSTVVVFGSVRALPPEIAQQRLDELLDEKIFDRDDPEVKWAISRARSRLKYSYYYSEAQKFAQILTNRFQKEDMRDFVIVTGGGPGIMEAANRGASDANGISAAFNITLPQVQEPNQFVTPGLCFQFHYFALRKMHFLMRAKALVAFPGGYGTLDELFEALTLLQTHKIPLMPVILVEKEFWQRVIGFDFLLAEGMIDEQDLELFRFVETAEEAVSALHEFYRRVVPFD